MLITQSNKWLFLAIPLFEKYFFKKYLIFIKNFNIRNNSKKALNV